MLMDLDSFVVVFGRVRPTKLLVLSLSVCMLGSTCPLCFLLFYLRLGAVIIIVSTVGIVGAKDFV